jgi:hypothetical protein
MMLGKITCSDGARVKVNVLLRVDRLASSTDSVVFLPEPFFALCEILSLEQAQKS